MCYDCVFICLDSFGGQTFYFFIFLSVFVNSSAGFLKTFLSSFGHWWLFHSFSVLVLDHFQKSIFLSHLTHSSFSFCQISKKQCQRQLFDRHNNSILCRNKVITNVFLVQILVYFSMICSANLKKLVVAGLKITSSQLGVSGSLKAKTGYRRWCIWSFSWSICYWLKLYQKSSKWKVGCQDASLKEGRQVYLKDSLLKQPHQETNITD